MFDRSGTGYIGASDLRVVLQCIGEDLDEEESESHFNIDNFSPFSYAFFLLYLWPWYLLSWTLYKSYWFNRGACLNQVFHLISCKKTYFHHSSLVKTYLTQWPFCANYCHVTTANMPFCAYEKPDECKVSKTASKYKTIALCKKGDNV